MESVKVGILGAGIIAIQMAQTIAASDCATAHAVASRDLARAQAFAQKHGFQTAYGSYEAMLADPELELVYVATPHALHFEHAKLCLEHGKAVLCEKPFTVNSEQAAELLAIAEVKGLFLCEAMWTRFLPVYNDIVAVIESGKLGRVRMLTANFGFPSMHIERMARPELAGGALLDLGVYALTLADMLFGSQQSGANIDTINTSAVLTDAGVDARNHTVIRYTDDRTAVLVSAMDCNAGEEAWVYGDAGKLHIDCLYNCVHYTVYTSEGKEVFSRPPQTARFEDELSACCRAIRAGARECAELPHEKTLFMMSMMDSLREAWGLRYPFE